MDNLDLDDEQLAQIMAAQDEMDDPRITPRTEDIDVFAFHRGRWKPPFTFHADIHDVPITDDRPLAEAQKKAWAETLLARIGSVEKNRIKEFMKVRRTEYRERQFGNALVTAYFREYRGDVYRNEDHRGFIFDPKYKTPSWAGIDEDAEDAEIVDLRFDRFARRPWDAQPEVYNTTSSERRLYEEADSEMQRLTTSDQRSALRERRQAQLLIEEEMNEKRLERQRKKDEATKQQLEAANAAWLASNREIGAGHLAWWEPPFAGSQSKWIGQKVLGEGGNGRAGLWKYESKFILYIE